MILKLHKMKSRKKHEAKKMPSRITNDTVAEHRERVLAGGRKHKYPIQYTKHRLVWNAIFIGIAALIAALVLVWAQLYVWRDTGDIAYRITRTIPLPVASVDGTWVRYSDYLMIHRSNMAVLAKRGQQHAEDKVAFQRQRSMEVAIENVYAEKLARERSIAISDERVMGLIEQQRKERSLSENAYATAVKDQLGWSLGEARQALRANLLRREVAFAVDEAALRLSEGIATELKAGKKLSEIAQARGQAVQYVPRVSVAKNNADGGLTAEAAKLKAGETSGIVKTVSGDAYHFISVEENTDQAVTYGYIRVPLTEFKRQLEELKKAGKIKYFIKL